MSSADTHEAYVYVLTLISVDHANNHRPELRTVGVYTSKAAAAYAAGSIDTEYGTFDYCIEEMFEEDHIDNRGNPPDYGCLLQIGSRNTGQGDFVGLKIEPFPLESATGTSSVSTSPVEV